MQFLNIDQLNSAAWVKWFVLLATALSAILALAALFKGLISWFKNRITLKNIAGIYAGEHTNHETGEKFYEIVSVNVAGSKASGRSVYVHGDQKYLLLAYVSQKHRNVLVGNWFSTIDSLNYGTLLLQYGSSCLNGRWTGTKRDSSANCGDWFLRRLSTDIGLQVSYRLGLGWRCALSRWVRVHIKHAIRARASKLLTHILEKHERSHVRMFTYRNTEYSVADGVFNPIHGKITKKLLDIAIDSYLNSNTKTVLDWGTGCGFYALEIGKSLIERGASETIVYGIDCDPLAIKCAESNFQQNGRPNNVKFKMASNIWEIHGDSLTKFDLIVANLPFSRTELVHNYRHHRLYSCFHARSSLLFQVCLGLKNQLSQSGKTLLTFGTSGDRQWLDTCMKISNLEYREIYRHDKSKGATDDDFFVLEVTHSGA